MHVLQILARASLRPLLAPALPRQRKDGGVEGAGEYQAGENKESSWKHKKGKTSTRHSTEHTRTCWWDKQHNQLLEVGGGEGQQTLCTSRRCCSCCWCV